MKSGIWFVLFAIATLVLVSAGCADDTDDCADPCACGVCPDGGDADADTRRDDGEPQYCAEVQVNLSPPGVAVTIRFDGQIKSCVSQCVLDNVPVGQHLTFSSEGYVVDPPETIVATECEDVNLVLHPDANCPNVTGNWEITYLPAGSRWTIQIEQDGCSLASNVEGDCIFAGEINESGSLSLSGECSLYTQTMTGNLVSPTRMTGDWSRSSGTSGTWEADLQ